MASRYAPERWSIPSILLSSPCYKSVPRLVSAFLFFFFFLPLFSTFVFFSYRRFSPFSFLSSFSFPLPREMRGSSESKRFLRERWRRGGERSHRRVAYLLKGISKCGYRSKSCLVNFLFFFFLEKGISKKKSVENGARFRELGRKGGKECIACALA